jgi:hypothetical protein
VPAPDDQECPDVQVLEESAGESDDSDEEEEEEEDVGYLRGSPPPGAGARAGAGSRAGAGANYSASAGAGANYSAGAGAGAGAGARAGAGSGWGGVEQEEAGDVEAIYKDGEIPRLCSYCKTTLRSKYETYQNYLDHSIKCASKLVNMFTTSLFVHSAPFTRLISLLHLCFRKELGSSWRFGT